MKERKAINEELVISFDDGFFFFILLPFVSENINFLHELHSKFERAIGVCARMRFFFPLLLIFSLCI